MADRVLVTGGTGVVGSAAVRALRAQGHDVVSLQRSDAPAWMLDLGVQAVRGDVTDSAAVARALAGADGVVHAAARVEITGPWAEFERVNVDGTRTVIDAARTAGVRRIVVVSSPSVAHAGRALVGSGADPADPKRARGNYSRSKAMAESLALSANDDALAVTAVRPHLVWGVGDTQLTARIVARARASRLVIVGSGAALIDTTYIDNAGSALVAALARAEDPRVRGHAFVVSNGEPRTVAEMLTRIARAAGAPEPRRHVPYAVAYAAGRALETVWERGDRPGEPPITGFLAEQLATAHWFDQRRTREALAWRPEVGLEEGFARLAADFASAG